MSRTTGHESETSDESVSSSESTTDSCQCPCCSDPSTPHHPVDVSSPVVTQTHRNKDKGMKTYTRHIQPIWYKKFPWISVCSSSLKIYCSVCRAAKFKGMIMFSKHYKPAFVQNLKKATERFREHESSNMHTESVMKLAATRSASNGVDVRLSTQLERDQRDHRLVFMKLLTAIKYLTRQGLPIRGHNEDDESFEGNLYQLLLLQAQDCPIMELWLHHREYISPEIINELITMMGLSVLRKLLDDIRASLWFAILADEAMDISRHEQMSLSIR